MAPSAVDEPGRAVWLRPTPEFQRARFEERGLPQAARDVYLLLADTIALDAAAHGVPVLPIDGALGVDEVLEEVERRFLTALAAGPTAGDAHERRALLREANLAQVQQVRVLRAAVGERRPRGRGAHLPLRVRGLRLHRGRAASRRSRRHPTGARFRPRVNCPVQAAIYSGRGRTVRTRAM